MIEPTPTIWQRAWQFAKNKHEGQLDDEGRDYFQAHVFPVFKLLVDLECSDNVLAAALLHDTIEDTVTTYEELVREFNKTIADLVMEMTHEGSKAKGYYFPRLHSKDAIMIKLADRLSNISRMGAWDEKRKQQYLRKTKFWKSSPD